MGNRFVHCKGLGRHVLYACEGVDQCSRVVALSVVE